MPSSFIFLDSASNSSLRAKSMSASEEPVAFSAPVTCCLFARIKLGRTLLRQKHYVEAEAEVSAGYQILKKQANPSVSWLKYARTDLAEIYDALHQTEKSTAFRKELALMQSKK
jgi:uncharacterized protein HemY